MNCSLILLTTAIFTFASSFDANGAKIGDHCTDEIVKALKEIIPSPLAGKVSAQDVLTKIKINSAEFTKNISGLPKDEVVSLLISDPGVQWIAKDITEDKIQIAMNRREASREGIAKSGFLNQFETGRSGAEFSPEQREKVESFFTGIDAEEYKKLDVSERPKYGYVAPPFGSKIKLNKEVQGYGPDIYYFKKDVSKRSTWYPSDTLDQYSHDGFWSDDPAAFRFKVPLFSQRVLTWNDRDLMLLHLKRYAKEVQPESFSVQEFGTWDFETDSGITITHKLDPVQTYFETQIWGKLTLDDVDSFVFSGNPPEGIFLETLRRKKIKILQVVDGKEVPWGIDAGMLNDPVRGPVGTLQRVNLQATGSTGGYWAKDSKGTLWFVKGDALHEDLQTSAEVISSQIYSFFGYHTPDTVKLVIDGKVVSASKSIGTVSVSTDFSELNSPEVRQLRVVASYLNDWDRLGNPENNRILPDGSLVLLDFGGTLGSRARGEFKPGKVWYPSIGVFDPDSDIRGIYSGYRVTASKSHPWNVISKDDAAKIVEKFKQLTDDRIKSIVFSAHYKTPKEEKYMIRALAKRRDTIIKSLLELF